MTTQVVFKIDKKLKEQAMKKAQKEGIAFSSVLQHATKAFVDGKISLELVTQPQLNAKTKRMLTRELKEIKAGKNISPAFTNAKDAIDYLNNL